MKAGNPANAALDVDTPLLVFLEKWEAFVGYVYDDKRAPRAINGKLAYPEWDGERPQGTLTIGIGHTKAAAGHWPMQRNSRITHEQARDLLGEDIEPCAAFVRERVKVPLNQGQFNALVSFVYNVGQGAFANSSVLSKLNAGNYSGSRAALALYNKSGGETMLGLKRRRAAEQMLWNEDATSVAALDPTHQNETMEEVVPKADPNVDMPKSMASSSEGWGSLAQTGAGLTSVGNETNKALDHVVAVKERAEQFGIEPISLFGKAGPVIDVLVHSPVFWISAGVAVIGVFLFFRRRWRLHQEL